MSLCIVTAAGLIKLAASTFTLGWTHSIEKTRWEEDWRVTEQGLLLEEARIEHMGAGMEPGDGARFDGHWWRWTPKVPILPEVLLRRSDAIPQGWSLCANGQCQRIGTPQDGGDIMVMKPGP